MKRPRPNASNATRSVGLARALSKLGYCSRTQAAALIVAGRVRLNATVRRDPETPTRPGQDKIEVDGREIRSAEKSYWILNKPRGVVSTASDEKGRNTVYDCLGEHNHWLAPVGRLDKASEGLLLMTNDSEWAARVTAPQTHLSKTYHVQICALADDRLLQSLRQGVPSQDQTLSAVRVNLLRRGERNSWLEIVLDEGKNRQIRRMLQSLGVQVLRLVRVSIGSLHLGDLPKGASRQLSAAEKSLLDTEMNRSGRSNSTRFT